MTEALHRARHNEAAQIRANRELQALRASLEERVAHRTQDLQRRTAQLQAAADVSRTATSILEPEQLMWQATTLIQERFGLYHVGLFQLDPTRRWAVYLAGAGEAAATLAEQRFRLEVGGDSLVGWCTAHGQAQIVHDVHTDVVRYEHPLVSKTRSEAALPLIARGQVIGALSLQSDTPGTFDADTASVLQTITDQVAVSLDNARLFSESQQALEAARRAYGEMTRQAWAELLRTRADWGYRYTQQTITSVGGDWQPEMIQALQTGQIVQEDSSGEAALAIPLRVRDEVVGVLSFYRDSTEPIPGGVDGDTQRSDQAGRWTAGETRLLEQMIQQLGLALESAQFYEETQRRAAREETIRHVTDQMRRAVDVEAILQNTITELARALGAPRAYVRLGTELELQGTRSQVQPAPTPLEPTARGEGEPVMPERTEQPG
jgi:GAF domain-containing protein